MVFFSFLWLSWLEEELQLNLWRSDSCENNLVFLKQSYSRNNNYLTFTSLRKLWKKMLFIFIPIKILLFDWRRGFDKNGLFFLSLHLRAVHWRCGFLSFLMLELKLFLLFCVLIDYIWPHTHHICISIRLVGNKIHKSEL